MFNKRSEKISPRGLFSKEFKEIIDDFGYKWNLEDKNIIIYPQKKNEVFSRFERFLDKFTERLADMTKPMIASKAKSTFSKIFTPTKFSAIKEIPADFLMILIFSVILWEFTLRAFDFIGALIILVAIVTVLISLIKSVHLLFLSDEEYLGSLFSFKREGNVLKTLASTIVKKQEHSKERTIFFSLVFLLIAVLAALYKYPQLVFVNDFLNIVAFFLVIAYFSLELLSKRGKLKENKELPGKIVAISLLTIFFLGYLFALLSGQIVVNRVIGLLLDLIVIYGIVLFIREAGKLREYRKWAKHNII